MKKSNFEIIECSICGSLVKKQKHLTGKCKNCGWRFQVGEEEFERQMGISYPMIVSPTTARAQYKQGVPFKATFDEFVSGLNFYSEMQLKHNGVMYEVFLRSNKSVVFCSNKMQQEYLTIEGFKNKAHIDGRLLKDIWDEVAFAGFMSCCD